MIKKSLSVTSIKLVMMGVTLWTGSLAVLLVTMTGSCGTNDVVDYDLPPDAGGQGGRDAGGGGGASSTGAGGAGGETCSGKCLPLGPADWSGPALLWMGHAESEAPECPPDAPVSSAFVFNELNAPNTCGTCKCEAPSGSCALPTMLTASNKIHCDFPPGTILTPFNAPAAWDGSCTAANPVPANKKCNGVDCVQSLTTSPLTLTNDLCAVSVDPVPPNPPALWGAVARTCRGSTDGFCTSPAEDCAPLAPPGFEQCLIQNGDRKCPSTYPAKHLFYEGLEDTRDCAPCACSAPTGSICLSLVSTYTDSTCSTPLAAITVTSADTAACEDVPSGSPLGSKKASGPVYNPGVCQVLGGEPVGQAAPVKPTTFCCLPSET